jgi:hypothetical protein
MEFETGTVSDAIINTLILAFGLWVIKQNYQYLIRSFTLENFNCRLQLLFLQTINNP